MDENNERVKGGTSQKHYLENINSGRKTKTKQKKRPSEMRLQNILKRVLGREGLVESAEDYVRVCVAF